MPAECPVKGCNHRVKSHRHLARNARPARGACPDCALRNRSERRCQGERGAEQADHGRCLRIILTNDRNLIFEDLKGNPGADALPSGEGVNPDCSSRRTAQVISVQAVWKAERQACNLRTGLLKKEIPAGAGAARKQGRREIK